MTGRRVAHQQLAPESIKLYVASSCCFRCKSIADCLGSVGLDSLQLDEVTVLSQIKRLHVVPTCPISEISFDNRNTVFVAKSETTDVKKTRSL